MCIAWEMSLLESENILYKCLRVCVFMRLSEIERTTNERHKSDRMYSIQQESKQCLSFDSLAELCMDLSQYHHRGYSYFRPEPHGNRLQLLPQVHSFTQIYHNPLGVMENSIECRLWRTSYVRSSFHGVYRNHH